jgi:hypothetical protein
VFSPKDFNLNNEGWTFSELTEAQRMDTENRAKRQRVDYQSIALVTVVVVFIILSGWALVVVSTTFSAPQSDFVTMPNTPPSKSGADVIFSNVSPVADGNVAAGVRGYLLTRAGSSIAGASVYISYYFQGSYRTQVAVTDQNGLFQVQFPMNWTGWLPLTLTYFGDAQHRGLTQVVSVSGENLAVGRINTIAL